MDFSIISGNIEEFATFDNENIKKEEELEMSNGVSIKVNFKEEIIAIIYNLIFNLKNDPIIKLKTRHEFQFSKELWSTFYQDEKFIIKKEILNQIGDISIGSSRGMLITKLNNTKYQEIIIPYIEINNIIDQEINANLSDIKDFI
ncbi:hypothetical protein IF125_11455 [Empedobacter stercoris]|uniref:hypothetical protein n=1 Tax=Empedobacter stercoris TaxID=1628248 RepID=UPI001CE18997|nr:hypothetical protein [Empedobacter stercoris]MCA4782861.1 hypothetical protein [Empedobacter stercoris]